MQLIINFDGDKPEWFWRYLDLGAPEFLLNKVNNRKNLELLRYKVNQHNRCDNFYIIRNMGSLCGTVCGDAIKTLEVSLPRLTLKEQAQLNVTLASAEVYI